MTTLRPAHLGFGVVSVGVGVAAAVWGQSLISGNEAAANTIVTVFSILAGFLVAIMTLLGGDAVQPGSWRLATAQRSTIRAKLTRQKWLFYLYLTTLSLIFRRLPHPEAVPGCGGVGGAGLLRPVLHVVSALVPPAGRAHGSADRAHLGGHRCAAGRRLEAGAELSSIVLPPVLRY